MGDRNLVKEVCPKLRTYIIRPQEGNIPVEQSRIRLAEKGKSLVYVPTKHVQFDRHAGLVTTAAHVGHCQPVVAL
jgi:hypothetical protein